MNIPKCKFSVFTDEEYAQVLWNTDDSIQYHSAHFTDYDELKAFIQRLIDSNFTVTVTDVRNEGIGVEPTKEWWKARLITDSEED